MRLMGPQKLVEAVQNAGNCVGCGACVDLCPYFRNHRGKTGQVFECDLDQGRCFAYCPKVELDLDELAQANWGGDYPAEPLGRYGRIMVAKAATPAANVQGGGVVSSLMGLALDRGTVSGAVLTDRDGLNPRCGLAENAEGIEAYAGSKYMASPTLAALNRAAAEGKANLGVAVTPCQATALAQMRANPLGREDFSDPVSLVVGLFCNWSLDTRKLAALLSETVDPAEIIGMDVPPPPAEVFQVKTAGGMVDIPLAKVRPLIPQGCFLCTDMTAEWADISVGMMEGRPGWNTLITRTEKGAALVDLALERGIIQTEKYPTAMLVQLSRAAMAKKKRSLTKAQKDGLLNCQGEDEIAALRLNAAATKAFLAGE